MREIVLDTETTGLDPDAGDRIVEIGAVELLNQMPTGRTFHRYVNPQRDVPAEAVAVHGLSAAFLADKPVFAAVAAEFAAFVGDARLVIHNAAFDMRFLNAELGWAGQAGFAWARAVDTLELARRRFPGAVNSLDALCRRFGVDNSGRAEARGAARFGAPCRGLSRADGRPAAGPGADGGDFGRRSRRDMGAAAAAAGSGAAAHGGRGGGACALRGRAGR